HTIFVRACRDSALRLFPDEEDPQLVLYDLEKMAEVLANELVPFGYPVPYGAERTASQHAKTLLQLNVRYEPALQIFPGIDVVVDRTSARLDRLDITQQDLVDQTFLASEIMIKLTFSCM